MSEHHQDEIAKIFKLNQSGETFMVSRKFLSVIGSFFFIGTAQSAFSCDFCDANVTLNDQLSECYLEKYEAELNLMEKDQLPAQLINLGSCKGAQSVTRGTGLPKVPKLTGEGQVSRADITLSFLLDAQGLKCLAQDLKKAQWAPESILTFEVNRDCETD